MNYKLLNVVRFWFTLYKYATFIMPICLQLIWPLQVLSYRIIRSSSHCFCCPLCRPRPDTGPNTQFNKTRYKR